MVFSFANIVLYFSYDTFWRLETRKFMQFIPACAELNKSFVAMIMMPYGDPDHNFVVRVRGGIKSQIHLVPDGIAQIPPPNMRNISYAVNVDETYLVFPESSLVTKWYRLSTLISDGACEIIVNNQQREMTDVECRQQAVLFDLPQHQFSIRKCVN